MYTPDWLIQEHIENKATRIFNPKPLKQKARYNIKIEDE